MEVFYFLIILAPLVSGEVFRLHQCLVTSDSKHLEHGPDSALGKCVRKINSTGFTFSEKSNRCSESMTTTLPGGTKDGMHAGICPKDVPKVQGYVRYGEENTPKKKISDMVWNAQIGNVTMLRAIKDEGYNLSLGDYDNRTPLHLAATWGHIEAVKFLLFDCLVNPNPIDKVSWNKTPLSQAKHEGKHEIVKILEEWLSCFIEDSVFVDADNPGDTYSGLSTKEECRMLCQLASNCKFFNYWDLDCTLKNTLGQRQRKNSTGSYFGRKYCLDINEETDNTYIIVLSSIGGVIVLVCFALVVFRYLKRKMEGSYEDVRLSWHISMSKRSKNNPNTNEYETDIGSGIYGMIPASRRQFKGSPGPQDGQKRKIQSVESNMSLTSEDYFDGDLDGYKE